MRRSANISLRMSALAPPLHVSAGGGRKEGIVLQASNGEVPNWCLWSLAIYFALFVFEAPVRWGLSIAGVSGLIYLRDALLVALLVRAVAKFVAGSRVYVVSIFITLLLLIYIVYSFWVGIVLPQLVFGLKVALPAMVAYAYGSSLLPAIKRAVNVAVFFVLMTAVGVIVNSHFKLPWEGLLVKIGDASVSVGRVWYNGEMQRLPGFARASYDAAMFSLFFFIVLGEYVRVWVRLVLWLVVVVTVVLTTTKGIFLSLFVITFVESARAISFRLWDCASVFLSRLFVLLGVILPVVSIWYRPGLKFDSFIERSLMFSFCDRMANTWPGAFLSFKDLLSVVFGNGIGSIGAAQAYFDPSGYNPADNLFVYVSSVGGVFLVALIFLSIWRVSRFSASDDCVVVRNIGLLVAVYGVTTNLVDNPLLCFAIGLLVSCAILPKRGCGRMCA